MTSSSTINLRAALHISEHKPRSIDTRINYYNYELREQNMKSKLINSLTLSTITRPIQ